jgi:NADH-quinone oxidoreductase subunit G
MAESESRLIGTIVDIMQKGPVRSPSLNEIMKCDAVLILGEDVTNVAPLMALALRQSVRQKPMADLIDKQKIPHWDDKPVRELIQDQKGPCFIATTGATKLEEIATGVYHAAPDELARLGFAVAHALNDQMPPVNGLEDGAKALVAVIAAALKGAQRPLVVSGPSSGSDAIIQAAASVASALASLGLDARLSFTMPEANSLGVALMGAPSLEAAFKAAADGAADSAIILENDLYRRADPDSVDRFFKACKRVIALDHLTNPTTEHADIVFPAATFAEADGTLVNNEGRAQRFYQVFVPIGRIQASWQWIRDIMALVGRKEGAEWRIVDDLISAIGDAFPIFKPVSEIAPPANFRIAGTKIAREPARYSGRTAMFAHLSVHEPRPRDDPDTPFSFSMEGFQGDPPPALIPRFWAPGWNSIQAINKFQIEVGGPLRGGDPGKRLIEPKQGARAMSFGNAPGAFERRSGEWLVVPLYHIFGSEELSMLTPGVAEQAPQPYLALNPDDARRLNVKEGGIVEVPFLKRIRNLPVRIVTGLPAGVAGLPVGLPGMPGISLPVWSKLGAQAHTES